MEGTFKWCSPEGTNDIVTTTLIKFTGGSPSVDATKNCAFANIDKAATDSTIKFTDASCDNTLPYICEVMILKI